MAVVAVKSTLITNADATPVVLNSPRVDGGFERVSVATAAISMLLPVPGLPSAMVMLGIPPSTNIGFFCSVRS